MSDLSTFRDHARAMSTAEHKPECGESFQRPGWLWESWRTPASDCPGCVTDADRALWKRLADEVDSHLARHTEETLL